MLQMHVCMNTNTTMHMQIHIHIHIHIHNTQYTIQTWLKTNMILNQEPRTKHEFNQIDMTTPEPETDEELQARRA